MSNQEIPNPHNPYQYEIKNAPEEDNGLNVDSSKFEELLSDDERLVVNDLKKEYSKKSIDFDEFLRREYMTFDMKINRCLLNNCYKTPLADRAALRECINRCNMGIQKADGFVTAQIDRLQNAFQECLKQGSESQKNVFQETIQCYDTYINTFDSLKREIKKEFSYYQ